MVWDQAWNALRSVSFQRLDLVTIKRSHVYFPWDSATFDFDLTLDPVTNFKVLRLINHVPEPCARICPELRGMPCDQKSRWAGTYLVPLGSKPIDPADRLCGCGSTSHLSFADYVPDSGRICCRVGGILFCFDMVSQRNSQRANENVPDPVRSLASDHLYGHDNPLLMEDCST
jgi:hypothetical protein